MEHGVKLTGYEPKALLFVLSTYVERTALGHCRPLEVERFERFVQHTGPVQNPTVCRIAAPSKVGQARVTLGHQRTFSDF